MANLRSTCLIITLVLSKSSCSPSPGSWRPSRLVRLPQGRVQGEVRAVAHEDGRQARHQREVEVYLSLPYAEPPTGPLRFMPPVAPQPWPEAVRDARHQGPSCPQSLPEFEMNNSTLNSMSAFKYEHLRRARRILRNQSEDCLTLNVFAPLTSREHEMNVSDLKLGVLVIIEGQHFLWGGSALIDASVLAAATNLVVITLNYRLGVLGFLNSNRPGKAMNSPANVGLLDQIAALHWVQENVQYFGGDKRQVTVLGHNEGSACVHFLMSSKALPNAKTLFQRVVLMSGSALSPLSMSKTPFKQAQKLAERLDCIQKEEKKESKNIDILSCLRGVSLARLMTAATWVKEQESSVFKPVWAPSIDGVVVSAFARRTFAEYLHRMSDFGLMSIVSSGEAAYLTLNERQVRLGFDPDKRFRVLADFVSSVFEARHRDIFSAIITVYTDWKNGKHSAKMYRDETLSAIQDALFVVPVIETLDLHAQDARSWLMVVDHQPRASEANPELGCMRGEAMQYLLGQQRNLEEDERLMALTMLQYVANFVRTGDPNARGDSIMLMDDLEPWNQYELETKAYMHMGLKARLRSHFRSQQLALWLNLVPDLLDGARRTPSDLLNEKKTLDEPFLDEYKSHDEILAFIPKLKSLTSSWLSAFASRPASSEVMWPSFENESRETAESSNNTTVTRVASDQLVLENYSSALSVTVALGCSLLVLNVLIFVAVYHHNHRDDNLKSPVNSAWDTAELYEVRPTRSSLKKSNVEQRRQFREQCTM